MGNLTRKQQLWAAGGLVALLCGIGIVGSVRNAALHGSDKPLAPLNTQSITFAATGNRASSSMPTEKPPSDVNPVSTTTTMPAEEAKPTQLTVFVSGAVKRPGVYTVKVGSRIEDAIHAAGGFKPNAVEDALNRADLVQDADQIHVLSRAEQKAAPILSTATSTPASAQVRSMPLSTTSMTTAFKPLVTGSLLKSPKTRHTGRVLGKTTTTVVATVPPSDGIAASVEGGTTTTSNVAKSSAKGGSKSAKFKNPGDGTVNLNTATQAELEKLPGVGPAMSAKILEYRQQIGKFASIDQIKDIRGIGEKKFAKMQPFVTVE